MCLSLGAGEPGSPVRWKQSHVRPVSRGSRLGPRHAAVSLLTAQPLARNAWHRQPQPSVCLCSCPQAPSSCLLAQGPRWEHQVSTPTHLAGLVVQSRSGEPGSLMCLTRHSTSWSLLQPSFSLISMRSQLVSPSTTCSRPLVRTVTGEAATSRQTQTT